MKKKALRGWLPAVALGLTVLSGAQPAYAQAAKKTTLLMNYVLYGRHAPYYVALDKGYFKAAGFDVEIQPSSGSGFVISAVDQNKAEYGMSDAATLVQNIAKGVKTKAFMAFLESTPNGLASLKPYPDLKSVLDSKVAAAAADSARAVLPIVLQLNGLDPAKLQWQTAANTAYISLLMGGQIDSFSASIDADIPPLIKLLAPQGKQPYFASFAEWGYDGLGFLLVAHSDRIAQKPDEVKAFAAAVAKGVTDSLANPQEAAKTMVKYNPTLETETVLQQWLQTAKAIETPYTKQHGYGVVTGDRVTRTIELTRKAFTFDGEVKPDQVFAQGFVPGAK